MEEIKTENLKTLDIKQIALDKEKLGGLTFDKAHPFLDKLKKMLIDFDDLNFKDFLTIEEIKRIDGYKDSLTNFIKRINDFDPAKDTSFNKEAKDRLENEIENFYNSTTKSLREPLTYLRQETSLKSQDVKSLDEQKKAAIQAEKIFKDLSNKLQEEINELKTQKSEVEKGHGDLATTKFGIYFGEQAKVYSEKADKWLKTRKWFFGILLTIIIANFVLYLGLFITNKLGIWPHIFPQDFFDIRYAIAKLVLLSTLSYGVGFCSKQYNVNSHLSSTNKHRQSVADTLNNFLSASPDIKSEMLKNGTEAMFKHISTGYIGKNENKETGNIIYEFINSAMPK